MPSLSRAHSQRRMRTQAGHPTTAPHAIPRPAPREYHEGNAVQGVRRKLQRLQLATGAEHVREVPCRENSQAVRGQVEVLEGCACAHARKKLACVRRAQRTTRDLQVHELGGAAQRRGQPRAGVAVHEHLRTVHP